MTSIEFRAGISRLHHPVTTLGPGQRIGIWFQGCSIRCSGCMSHDTWEPAPDDQQVPADSIMAWASGIPRHEVDGITISGGEPFDQPMALGELTRRLRTLYDASDIDILVYSGYPLAVLTERHSDALAAIDAVITEPYRRNLGTQLRWRGSSNQQIVPLTELGRRRYIEHLDAPADTGLQVDVHDGTTHLIGVPRPGDLQRIELALAQNGITFNECSWT